MNFFDHQDAARKSSVRLVALFIAGVLSTILAVYLLCLTLLGVRHSPQLFVGCAALISAVIAIASLSKMRALRSGGSAVAEMMGGRRIDPGTADISERRLLNVVEEMSIASGIPVPVVYELDSDGINAFAAGWSVDDAAVAVTRGCLDLLTREELQGVIAHEFSHIMHGDMRLNIRLIGMLAGLTVLGTTGIWIMYVASGSSSRRNRKGNSEGIALAGLALAAVGYAGLLFGRLTKAALSRQREYLADASAVQFTRSKDGLAGALKKIGGLSHGSKVHARGTEELSHLFFADALRPSFFGGLMATHPPLETRVRRIDPSFDGAFDKVVPGALRRQDVRRLPAVTSALSPTGAPALGRMGAGETIAAAADEVVDSIGAPALVHVDFGRHVLDSAPKALRDATRQSMTAVSLSYGLLLDRSGDVRARQMAILEEHGSPAVVRHLKTHIMRWLPHVSPGARLPLLELSSPALRNLAPQQCARLLSVADALIAADDQVTLFEFAFEKVLRHHLENATAPVRRRKVAYKSTRGVLADLSRVLSSLAYAGHHDDAAAEHAFDEARGALPSNVAKRIAVIRRVACGFDELGPALDRLATTKPTLKEKVVDACARAALADRTITVQEAELLRAFAATLDSPLPPFLPKG